MSDILETVEKLKKVGLIDKIAEGPNSIQHNVAHLELPDSVVRLHIEAQTYLLAEILQEMRKMNNPPIFNFSAASSLWSSETRPDSTE